MSDPIPQTLLAGAGLVPLIVSNGLNVLGAIVILIVGWWLAGRADRLVVRMLGRTPHFDEMLTRFFGSLTRYSVLTITGLAVLSEFGIQTTSLIAVLGAASLAVGLALQGTLANLAAGVMLLIFRPFRIGHQVQVGGADGVVKELTLFWTELVTSENVQVIIPNHSVWGQMLRNFSVYPPSPAPPAAAEVRFRIPETTQLDRVMAKVAAAADAVPNILRDPAPSVLLDRSAADNAMEIVVGFVADKTPVTAVRSELIKAVHDVLCAEAAERS
jgi:small conductance mechanosensitive channel